MEDITCYYIVKARTSIYNKQTKETESKAVEKKFENANPILAREAAFKFRNEFIYGMLTGVGLTDDEIGWNSKEREFGKLSDREIRKLINPFLENDSNLSKTTLRKENDSETETEWQAPDDSLTWYPQYNNGIWVIMKHNDEQVRLNDWGDLIIDKVCRYKGNLPEPPLYVTLEEERIFYQNNHFNTKAYKTTITFFDDELYIEGPATEEEALTKVTILKTPFDWTDYDKIYWWDKKKQSDYLFRANEAKKIENTTLQEALPPLEIIGKGENEYVEYKPGMINRPGSIRKIEYEVAKTIAAFLNTKGGYLIIGVSDEFGEIIGLDFTKISKDDFLREFTRIKCHYLPPFIAHTIYGAFYQADNKEIFIVTVSPSKSEPIFLRKKDLNSNRTIQEFFVRSDAASRHLYNLEEIWKYCKDRWR